MRRYQTKVMVADVAPEGGDARARELVREAVAKRRDVLLTLLADARRLGVDVERAVESALAADRRLLAEVGG